MLVFVGCWLDWPPALGCWAGHTDTEAHGRLFDGQLTVCSRCAHERAFLLFVDNAFGPAYPPALPRRRRGARVAKGGGL